MKVYLVQFNEINYFNAMRPRVFKRVDDAYDCLWDTYISNFDDDGEDRQSAEAELEEDARITDVGWIEEVEVE